MKNDDALFAEILRYVGIEPHGEEVLRRVGGFVRERLTTLLDELCGSGVEHYAWCEASPREGSCAAMPHGRMEALTREWLGGVLDRPWTTAGVAERAAFGRRFAHLNAPRHAIFLAASVVRSGLVETLLDALRDDPRLGEGILAINRVLDLEIAAVIHGYGENLILNAQQAGRLSTLGELAASIGHELRNPLGVIDSTVFLMRKRVATEDPLVAHLNRIEGQVRISSRIIEDLLAIARDRPPIAEPIEISALVAEACEAVPLRPGVELTIDVPHELPSVRVDPNQMRQVLVNLLANAADAVGGAGAIRIGAEVEAGWLALRVSDSGAGVDPDLGARIFEPLVTTKDRGIGLGLSLCRRLVERAAGTISVEAGPLRGASFVVRLPIRTTEAKARSAVLPSGR